MVGLIVIICVGLAIALYFREAGRPPVEVEGIQGSGCGCFLAVGLLVFALLAYLGGIADSRFK